MKTQSLNARFDLGVRFLDAFARAMRICDGLAYRSNGSAFDSAVTTLRSALHAASEGVLLGDERLAQ